MLAASNHRRHSDADARSGWPACALAHRVVCLSVLAVAATVCSSALAEELQPKNVNIAMHSTWNTTSILSETAFVLAGLLAWLLLLPLTRRMDMCVQ